MIPHVPISSSLTTGWDCLWLSNCASHTHFTCKCHIKRCAFEELISYGKHKNCASPTYFTCKCSIKRCAFEEEFISYGKQRHVESGMVEFKTEISLARVWINSRCLGLQALKAEWWSGDSWSQPWPSQRSPPQSQRGRCQTSAWKAGSGNAAVHTASTEHLSVATCQHSAQPGNNVNQAILPCWTETPDPWLAERQQLQAVISLSWNGIYAHWFNLHVLHGYTIWEPLTDTCL